MKNKLKALTDPISNKILQAIRVKGNMTVGEIVELCRDIPQATIYRRMDKLTQLEIIHVVNTNKIRGQIEKVYAIKEMFLREQASDEENFSMVTMSLMNILGQYEHYFTGGDADVNRDKLFLLNYAISLTDTDFMNMQKEIAEIVDRYQRMQNKEEVKLRNLYFLSAPGMVERENE